MSQSAPTSPCAPSSPAPRTRPFPWALAAIVVLTLACASAFWWITHSTPATSVAWGREVFQGKGRCSICHEVRPGREPVRCPNLVSIGRDASTRVRDRSATEYLLESLLEPTAYTAQGYPYGVMPAVNRETIFLTPPEVRALVLYLQSLGGTPDRRSVAAAEKRFPIPPPLPPAPRAPRGDAQAGRALFFDRQRANCASCHRVGDLGGDLGPELTDIGLVQSAAQLRQSIVKPNAEVTVGYRLWEFRPRGGGRRLGIPRNETPDQLELVEGVGRRTTLRTVDLLARIPHPGSPMPEGLLDDLAVTPQARDALLDDLIAFLTTCSRGP
ncbi:MAG: c-type cytochrome [Planctomycetes bacterium]|nr:c-type cytochrome [Planctomycetota bacterium]